MIRHPRPFSVSVLAASMLSALLLGHSPHALAQEQPPPAESAFVARAAARLGLPARTLEVGRIEGPIAFLSRLG